ncbi:hypothetical protein [Geodermatophilus dictyosporus]|uniref:hypothetical protein n=1 Tax=Geodermatophilus dictyosporus TaxID=1523247 RepID=UPI0010AAC2F5|nr:hypothetical protein [Geodermatophilus dictyosporus]
MGEGGGPLKRGTKRIFATVFAIITFVSGALAGTALDRWSPAWLDWLDVARGESLLNVRAADWPHTPCSRKLVASVAEGEQFPATFDALNRVVDSKFLLASELATAYQWGSMDLVLSGSTADTILVHSITPVIYRQTAMAPHWALADADGDCGGSVFRLLDMYLQNGEGYVVDRGLTGEGRPDEGAPALNGLGDVFTVSEDEPVALHLDVQACGFNYEFGLDIEYVLNGRTYHRQLGSRSDPFRIAGVEATYHFTTSETPGPDQIQFASERFGSPYCAD